MDGKNLVGLLSLLGLPAACMRTVTTEYPLPPLQEEVLLPSAQGDSALVTEFSVDEGARSVTGHVAWAASCRRALVERSRMREVKRSVPNGSGAVAAGVGAVSTGVAAGVLFGHLDAFSAEETCDTDANGDTSCSSPREGAAALGVVLAGTAIGLTAATIATMRAKSSVRGDREITAQPGAPRVVASDVACGADPIEGLGVAVYRAQERVAASTTDADGNVRLRLPEWLSGPVIVVADSVPWSYSLVGQNELLARLNVVL